ncbi:MAG: hypothetical protein Q9162_001433 [Coniocarpon cinnabarinum]
MARSLLHPGHSFSNSAVQDGIITLKTSAESRGQRSRKNSLVKPAIKIDDSYDAERTPPSPHTTHLTTSPQLKQQALDLLSRSVQDQSVTALRTVATHPLTLTLLAFSLFIVDRLLRFSLRNGKDAPGVGPWRLWCAITFTWLILVLFATGVLYLALRLPYRDSSLEINEAWLGSDEVIITVPSDWEHGTTAEDAPILGVLILSYRLREMPGSNGKRKPRRVGRGVIKAWCVDSKHAGNGIGEALLREAARVVSARNGDNLVFSEEHAHSQMVLSRFWGNGWLERRERCARERVKAVWDELRGRKGRW